MMHGTLGDTSVELTVLMPCLNEAETIADCVNIALRGIADAGVTGEVVVADNGSTDGSQQLATAAGARVVAVDARGYGAAIAGGIAAARGRWIIMGDADASYDFSDLEKFVRPLRAGADLVMGNRFRGGIAAGAMPPLHRYLGNPVLSFLGRLFFRVPIGDFHCGLRGFSREAAVRMDLRTTGMEFASEMIVKASLLHMRIAEVPTTLSPDGRSRPPHLRTWSDGWRHLRFLLIYSPRYLFLIPGLLAIAMGLAAGITIGIAPRRIGGVGLDIHTLLFAAGAVLLGVQSVFFAVFTKAFGITTRLLPDDPAFERALRYVRLETGLIAGALMLGIGILFGVVSLLAWRDAQYGALDPKQTMRFAIPAVFCVLLGAQAIFGSFFLSILGLRREGTR